MLFSRLRVAPGGVLLMKAWLARILVLCAGLGFAVDGALAVTFDPDVQLGDRRVLFTWAPDSDDPVFTGNLQLYFKESLPVSEGSLPLITFTQGGDDLWVWDDVDRVFHKYQQIDGAWQRDLETELTPLPEGLEPVSFAIHPEATLLLVGLGDGQVAYWWPHLSADYELYQAHEGAIRQIAFKPLATAFVTPYVTIGDDGFWRYWVGPDESNLVKEVQANTTGALTAVAIAPRGETVAVGSASGKIGFYSVEGSGGLPIFTVQSNEGRPIKALTFAGNQLRLASADDQGSIRIWSAVIAGPPLGGSDPDVPGEVFIHFTPRDSRYISYAYRNGQIGMVDGFTGGTYEARQDVGHPITAFALSELGNEGYLASTDGILEWWFLGTCVPSMETPECFGGYRIFRGMHPEDDPTGHELVLLRVYNYSDRTWTWSSLDSTRSFADPDSVIPSGGDSTRVVAGPQNGTPYYYSIQKYYWRFLDGGRSRAPANTTIEGLYRAAGELDPTPVIPRGEAVTSLPLLRGVYVVPNPFREGDELSHFWPTDTGDPGEVHFVNLPAEATIRIFTTAGDLVRTLHHPWSSRAYSGNYCPWNLRNDPELGGRQVASGVYVYIVETPSGEVKKGFCTIIR